ncbi:MAG: hypothetical protein LDLANPLL_02044 [Turneriella sp.]|nr:hypothetical protein [Turneriella sp.]
MTAETKPENKPVNAGMYGAKPKVYPLAMLYAFLPIMFTSLFGAHAPQSSTARQAFYTPRHTATNILAI